MASTVWRGFITFGLISIPVRLFRAARAERVSLRKLQRTQPAQSIEPGVNGKVLFQPPSAENSLNEEMGSLPRQPSRDLPDLTPLRQVSLSKNSGEVVAEASVVKGYEYEKDRYVAIEAEELKSLAAKTATEMQIAEFVKLAEVDPVYFETSYYVTPEDAGQKAYALLYRSLQLSELVAVAQFAMHGREHAVIVRPGSRGLIAHTMFFPSEVRAQEEYPADTDMVAAKELDLAKMLIHSLAAPFEPEKYRDGYRERLEAMIARRVAGQPVKTVEQPVRAPRVVDITEALQKSLAALKKPVASQPRSQKLKEVGTSRKKASSRGAS